MQIAKEFRAILIQPRNSYKYKTLPADLERRAGSAGVIEAFLAFSAPRWSRPAIFIIQMLKIFEIAHMLYAQGGHKLRLPAHKKAQFVIVGIIYTPLLCGDTTGDARWPSLVRLASPFPFDLPLWSA